MVVVQGESFWWGGGSLYDGGTLAVTADVIVITFNYRLGALGEFSKDGD